MHIFVGAFWALVGLVMLLTGSAAINGGGLSKRYARIFGAATIVLGLVVMSGNVFIDAGRRFVTRGIAVGAVFVSFVTVTVLFIAMATVKLARWARSGGGH